MFLLAILLTVLFAAAKIFHLIVWSWWLVFLPAILTYGVVLSFAGGCFVLAFLGAIFGTLSPKLTVKRKGHKWTL